MRGALILLAVAALFARPTIFSEGGSLGAWACFVVFWLSLAAYLAISFRDDVLRRRSDRRGPVVRWFLVAACIAAAGVWGVVDDPDIEIAARAVFYPSFLAAVVLSVREWRIRRRTLSSAPQ